MNPRPLEPSTPRTLFVNKTYANFDGGEKSKSLSDLCLELLSEQKNSWQELKDAYESLKYVREREVPCRGFSVRIQYNPGRIRSSLADVRENNVNERPCLLCLNNLPEDQKGIIYRKAYLILCNPAPVFSSHFTISHLHHCPQTIAENINTFLQLMADFGDRWAVLYNGSKCGASAPDHLHFQVIPSGQMPIEKEIREEKRLTMITLADGVLLYRARALGREIIILEGDDPIAVANVFKSFLVALKKSLLADYHGQAHGNLSSEHCEREGVAPAAWLTEGATCLRADTHRQTQAPVVDDEPMMNIAGFFDVGKWHLLIFPRAKHRPEVFFREGDARVVLSPAVIEMGGVLITPVEKDFERLDASFVEGIFGEVSLKGKTVDGAIGTMT